MCNQAWYWQHTERQQYIKSVCDSAVRGWAWLVAAAPHVSSLYFLSFLGFFLLCMMTGESLTHLPPLIARPDRLLASGKKGFAWVCCQIFHERKGKYLNGIVCQPPVRQTLQTRSAYERVLNQTRQATHAAAKCYTLKQWFCYFHHWKGETSFSVCHSAPLQVPA